MNQRPTRPPEPRVIAIAATQSKPDVKALALWGATYALSAIALCQWLSH